MPARLRPPHAADADAVLALIVARDIADLGMPDFTLEDLRADWASPGLDLEHDARVSGPTGAIRGYAILLGDDAVVMVHPEAEGEGDGTVLRRWAEARAAERGTAVLRQFASGSNDAARSHLRAAGYAPAQHYFRLRADHSTVPAAPAVPLRTYTAADEAAVHALIQEAFADIDGHEHQSLENWRAKTIAKEGHGPSLWLLLEDDEGLVGAALGERWEEGVGYVAELAVAARARGRGYGRTLLLALFEAFRNAGLEHAELSVHGRNRGALRLYESVGMRPTWQAERWEKALGRA
ncbi:MAG TPA: GNAT family N-acetyltransferase [Solirubrobacteraceae bacterium]|nr:GNAT family N-acetyltransferase [Solirubrobacteraceae bacterium]